VLAKLHKIKVVDVTICQPAMVSNYEFPGVPDENAWLDPYIFPNFCAEQPEQIDKYGTEGY